MFLNRVNTLSSRTTLPAVIFAALVLFSLDCAAQKQGQALIDSLVKALPKLGQDTNRIKALNLIGNTYTTVNPDTGARYCSEALALSKKLSWNKGVANSLNILGICSLYKSDFDKAVGYWNAAMELFEKEGDKKGMMKATGNIGLVYINQGNYPRALQNNFQALELAEALEDKKSIAIYLANIGSTYEYLKNFDKALQYDFKALKGYEALKDTLRIGTMLGNIGNLYSDLKKYGEALKFQQQALSYDERLGNTEGVVRDLLNIGGNYRESGNYTAALEYYFRSQKSAEHSGMEALQSKTLNMIGEALLMAVKDSTRNSLEPLSAELHDSYHLPVGKAALLRSAITYLQNSIAIDVQISSLDELMHNYNLLSEAQRMAGLPAEALATKEKYILIKDSVFSLESKVKITNLETQREIDLKNKQIEIDRLAVAKKRNERVLFMAGIGALLLAGGFLFRNVRLKSAKSLSEYKLQALQAQMNPHFIFNSLNSIQRIILQSDKMLAATYLADFSKLMRRILDNSHEQFVSLEAVVETLRMYVHLEAMRFNNEFSYEFRLDDDLPLEELKLPPMLLQPYVENAIIHGLMPKDGPKMLLIQLEEQDGALHCIVEDNGVGRDVPKASQGHISRGQELTKGMQESFNILLNIKATISYTDLKDAAGTASGTRVEIIIPLKA